MYFKESMNPSDAVILACSLLGLLTSFYFILVFYQLLKPDAAIVPIFCRLDETTCQHLMSTRNARILGVPNFVLGLLYYTAMALYAIGGNSVQKIISFPLVAFVSLLTVFLGMYLVYGLVAKLKMHCVLCYASHTSNLIIFLALMTKHF